MSELAEKCIKNMEEQFDPATACETVTKILPIVEGDMDRARAKRDFSCLQALAGLRSDLEPYARTCELSKPHGSEPDTLRRSNTE